MRLQAKIFQIKARITANSQSIGKTRNAELGYFSREIVFHELIRGSSTWFNSHCRRISQCQPIRDVYCGGGESDFRAILFDDLGNL